MKPSTATALKEMLLLVYSLGIYPTAFSVTRDEFGDEGFVLHREPEFERALQAKAEAQP